MNNILSMTVYGNYNIKDVLITAVIAAVVVIAALVIKWLLTKKEPPKYTQQASCSNCGWQGRVSSLAGRCPKCNRPLGAQKAKRN